MTEAVITVDTVGDQITLKVGVITASMSPATALEVAEALVKHAGEAMDE